MSARGRLRRFGPVVHRRKFGSVGDTRTGPLSLFLSLPFAEGLATQLDPVRVMDDAVQDGVRERGIADHRENTCSFRIVASHTHEFTTVIV
jgi:hypothetical protein